MTVKRRDQRKRKMKREMKRIQMMLWSAIKVKVHVEEKMEGFPLKMPPMGKH